MSTDQLVHTRVTRRGFLVGVAGTAAAAILTACGGSSSSATNAPASSGNSGTAAASGATSASGSAKSTVAPVPTAPGGAPTAMTAAGGAPTTAPAAGGAAAYTINNFPAITNATQAKMYANAANKVIFYGGHNDPGATDDKNRAMKFMMETGVPVTYVAGPDSTTDRYAEYQRFFSGKSPDLDILQIDVVYPAALATNLIDLGPKLGDVAKQHYPNIIQNNTVDGHLVGLPYAGDFGILYFRKDLLDKYGYKTPPKTWQELQEQATKIMMGEKASNPNFTGFVFQGKAYEGLTCDALEWFQSNGAGAFIDDGKATIAGDKGIQVMTLLQKFVGTISPKDVTSYGEEEARNIFQSGNAAFMRNWPYAYALASDKASPIVGKFDVSPLPAAEGQKPVGTVGGWQMGVSKYSRNPDGAIEFARWYCSPEMQTWNAVVRQSVPTIPGVAMQADVLKADPFLGTVGDVMRVTRPSSGLGENYNEGSTAIYQAINQILNGADPKSSLNDAQSKLSRLARQSK